MELGCNQADAAMQILFKRIGVIPAEARIQV
jgi:hypothetical protein